MPVSPSSRDRFWAHVTAFGALWGALEVTLGAFLHTVRIPFGGALLAAAGVGLMAAQRQVLPVRGASLATGMVTALCKTVSPGGVLIGPMAGILTEAALFEASLLCAPRSLVSAAAGGFLAVAWAALQKVLVQFLFYGTTLLELYLAILRKAGEWAGLPEHGGVWAVGVFLGILGGMGAGAAVLGGRYGRAAIGSVAVPGSGFPSGGPRPRAFPETVAEPGGSRRQRIWMAALGLFCLGAQAMDETLVSVVALAGWLTVHGVADRVSFRRLWMPRFWAVSLAFALGSGLLLGDPDIEVAGVSLSTTGIEAGIRLLVRGALVFGVSCWATRALAGKGIEWLTRRVGSGRLGQAVTVAFGLLPELADQLREHAVPGRRGPMLVAAAVQLAERLSVRAQGEDRRVAVVTGPPGSGKTTFLDALVRRLRSQGLRVGGVTQPAMVRDGDRAGYCLRDAKTGEERQFARRASSGNPGFVFDADGWAWAAERVKNARMSADVVVVDELGRIESEGGGHLPALVGPLDGETARVWIVAIRADRIDAVTHRLGGVDRIVAPETDEAGLDDLERFVVSFVSGSWEPTRPHGRVGVES